jgi:diaminopimelate decarboxylase
MAEKWHQWRFIGANGAICENGDQLIIQFQVQRSSVGDTVALMATMKIHW